MKKMLSMLFALIVAAAGSLSASTVFCAASSAGDHGTNVTASIAAPSADRISVDISWSSMEFTYTDGDWNAATHSYEGEGWNTDGGVITLKNNGTAEVDAAFSYAPAEGADGISVVFESLTNDILSLPAGENSSVRLILSGKPDQPMKNTPIGTVTVTISTAGRGVSGFRSVER